MAQTLAYLRWQLARYVARRVVVASRVLGREDRAALAWSLFDLALASISQLARFSAEPRDAQSRIQ